MQNSNDEYKARRTLNTADRVMLTLAVVLPLAAVSLVTYNMAVVTTPDLLPMWVAVPVGFVIGVLAVFSGVMMSGTDIMDVIVPSAVIVFLSLLWLPVAPRMKAQRLRKKGIVPTHLQKSSVRSTNNGLTSDYVDKVVALGFLLDLGSAFTHSRSLGGASLKPLFNISVW